MKFDVINVFVRYVAVKIPLYLQFDG